jgi:CDP-diacylglycerol pyrophosphatase
VLQAPSSATHVIVVPTALISGIESPALLRENAPNYWEAAWDARNRLLGLAGESLVESRWLKPFAESLLRLKRLHYDTGR